MSITKRILGTLTVLSLAGPSHAQIEKWEPLVEEYCLDCHDSVGKKGGIDFESALGQPLAARADVWEKMLRQVQARMMPPLDKKRPTPEEYAALERMLVGALDENAKKHPNPGRTETLRRLNRTEYRNVIRDLLALDVDSRRLLPADQASHGFDNVTVGDLSPALLDRYVSAAQKVSRMALGRTGNSPEGHTVRVRPDITQDKRVEGLPFGTRGGVLIPYLFPRDGDYDVRINLMRDRNEEVEGLRGTSELQILLDGALVESFEVKPPKNRRDHTKVDAHLHARISVKGGKRNLGVTFVENAPDLIETLRQPYESAFNTHRHPRRGPAVYQVSITGPFEAGATGETESRARLFGGEERNEDGARQILARIIRLAYRGQNDERDLARALDFYRESARAGGFEAGLESALSAILVSPKFIFRVERDRPDVVPGKPYALDDFELASRLSFFLWSSIPDDELLDAAAAGKLRDSEERAAQVRRMLADARASALVDNFAGQWLYLRNLDSFTPDGRLYPDFDDNLRQAMRRETELLFQNIVKEDRSVLDFLRSDYTFLNERLAKHYGIPHIYGDRFRRVALPGDSIRGGLLRHASILTVTSYANRTSPVLRGHWVLENLLGTPPPPPPPNIPALEDAKIDASLPVRQRLAKHREDPSCASCHAPMDPIGFAFEHFDAIGQWRSREGESRVDASGQLPNGGKFVGVDGLEEGILARPELFVRTLSEKLLIFALGRGIEPSDGPAVRRIVRGAAAHDYRFSEIILQIVSSDPFTMRMSKGE